MLLRPDLDLFSYFRRPTTMNLKMLNLILWSQLSLRNVIRKSLSVLLIGVSVATCAEPVDLTPTQSDALLNHIIRQQLTRYHFDRDQRPIDDEFSKDAFELFMKRVDAQKRLLLATDVEKLETLKLTLDDDFAKAKFHLPAMAAEAVSRNLQILEAYCESLLGEGSFDYEKEETLETDPEKVEYCSTMNELKDRWRRYLKYQCLGRYLSSVESEKSDLESDLKMQFQDDELNQASGSDSVMKFDDPSKESKDEVTISLEKDKELRETAKEKTLKQVSSYFERLSELSHQDHYSRYFNAITATFDPHTNYMDPATKEDFTIRMSKSLKGIGAVLQEEDDYTKVMRIVPGSASYLQGELEAGDIILRVSEGETGEEVDITGMRIREVVSYIRGEKGTVVKLTVKKSDGKTKVIAIERDIVKLEDAVAKSMSLKVADDRKYGYVYLPDFYRDFQNPNSRNCTDDIRNEINTLKKENIEGLIFDLRGNGGGSLEDARAIAGLFIVNGPVVQIKNSFNKVVVLRDDDRSVTFDKPVVILVDQFSASASEILAAALQDYHRAVVVGSEQTHGKGTVQHLISLDQDVPPRFKKDDLGSLKLTIQKFYRVDGGSTQMKGVIPDIILPDAKTYMESGERHIDHALVWDQISPVKYRAWQDALPLEALNKKSQARVGKSEVFKAIEERGQHLKERYDDTEVVLSREAMLMDRETSEEDAERYNKLIDDLKAKLDPEAFARDQKEKEAQEKADQEKRAQDAKVAESGKASSGNAMSGNAFAIGEVLAPKEPKKSPEEIKAESTRRWQEGVRIDPYVRESMAILTDWISMSDVK